MSAPIDLWWVLGALRRHWVIVLACVAVATVLAAVMAYRAIPRYTAWALVRLQDSRAQMVHGLIAPMEAGGRTLTDPLLSELHILTSRSMASRIVRHPDGAPLSLYPVGFRFGLLEGVHVDARDTPDTLRLQFGDTGFVVSGREGTRAAAYGRPVKVDGVRFALREPPGVTAGLLIAVPREHAVDSLLAHLEVTPRTRTEILDVGFTATDPEVAARVVNAAVAVFQEASVDAARDQARRRREFMEVQLRQNDSILTIAQNALSGFRGRNRAYSSQDLFAASQEGVLALELQRADLAVEYQTYQALLRELTREERNEGSPRIATLAAGADANPVVAQLYSRLLQYQAEYDSLTTGEYRSAEDSPDVRRVAALIASSREQLVEAVRSHMNSLGARLTVLDGLKAAREATFQELPAAEVEEAMLATRLDALRKLGDQLRMEYQRTRIEEAVEAGRLSIIDLATVPEMPTGVGPVTKIALGTILGLLLGGSAALLREARDRVIRRREDIETVLQLPWLAVIPRIRVQNKAKKRDAGRNRPRGNRNRLAGLLASGDRDFVIERAFAADAFRSLQMNVAFASDIEAPKVIAVTSAAAQDGKTTTAVNLAVAYAEQGARVLLIDCDLRRPRLHRLSGMPREPGLAEVILGRCEHEQVIRPIADNLWLLAAGAMPPNPPALLGSTQMRRLIGDLSLEYDVLLLDCPPALLGSDAALVGTIADGTLFVVRAGHTDRELAQDAVEQLRRVGVRVIGAALNDPEALMSRYTYDAHSAYKAYDYAYEQVVQATPLSASDPAQSM